MTKFLFPENHPQRFKLHNEVHSRAPIALALPVESTYLALSLSSAEKKQETIHLTELCELYGEVPPKKDVSHFCATLGSFQLRWEQHAEFSA